MNALIALLPKNDPLRTVHKVQKAYTYLRAANEYGAMPLIESFRWPCTTNCAPAVSDQELYTQAVTLLQDAADDVVEASLGDLDLMFGGDMGLWKKLANTLLLQTAMRMYTHVDARCAMGNCGPYTKAQLETMIQSSIQGGVLTDRDAKIFGSFLEDALLAGYGLTDGVVYATSATLLASTEVGPTVGGFSLGPFSKTLVDGLKGDPRLSRYTHKAAKRDWVMSSQMYELLAPDLPASSIAGHTVTQVYEVTFDSISPSMSIEQTKKDVYDALSQNVLSYKAKRTFLTKVKVPYGYPQVTNLNAATRQVFCDSIWFAYGDNSSPDCNVQFENKVVKFETFEKEELGQCATAYIRLIETNPETNPNTLGDLFANVTIAETKLGLSETPPARYDTDVWEWNAIRAQSGLGPITLTKDDLVMRNNLEAFKQNVINRQVRDAWRSGKDDYVRYVDWTGNEELATSCMELPEIVEVEKVAIEAKTTDGATAAVTIGGTNFTVRREMTVPIPDDTYLGVPPRINFEIEGSTNYGFSRVGPEVWDPAFQWGSRVPTPDDFGVGGYHHIITAAETNLLLAEATVYGLTSAHGTAESLVKTAVQHSYEQFRAEGTAPLPDYTGKTTQQKLEHIWQQKWLAVFPDVLSAWNIIRETGVPHSLYQVPDGKYSDMGKTNGRVPQRMEYPLPRWAPAFQKALPGYLDSRNTPLWWSKTAVDPKWNATFVDGLETGLSYRVEAP